MHHCACIPILLLLAVIPGEGQSSLAQSVKQPEARIRLVRMIAAHTPGASCLCFTEDGARLVSGGDDDQLVIGDAAR